MAYEGDDREAAPYPDQSADLGDANTPPSPTAQFLAKSGVMMTSSASKEMRRVALEPRWLSKPGEGTRYGAQGTTLRKAAGPPLSPGTDLTNYDDSFDPHKQGERGCCQIRHAERHLQYRSLVLSTKVLHVP